MSSFRQRINSFKSSVRACLASSSLRPQAPFDSFVELIRSSKNKQVGSDLEISYRELLAEFISSSETKAVTEDSVVAQLISLALDVAAAIGPHIETLGKLSLEIEMEIMRFNIPTLFVIQMLRTRNRKKFLIA